MELFVEKLIQLIEYKSGGQSATRQTAVSVKISRMTIDQKRTLTNALTKPLFPPAVGIGGLRSCLIQRSGWG